MTGSAVHRSDHLRRRLTLVVSAAVTGLLLQVVPLPAAAGVGKGLPGLPAAEKPVPGVGVTKAKARTVSQGGRTPQQAPKASWPAPATATVRLSPEGKAATRARGHDGTELPIALAPAKPTVAGKSVARSTADSSPPAVAVNVLGRQQAQEFGVDGLLFTLKSAEDSRTEVPAKRESVQVNVDYSRFVGAFGGSYANRLSLVTLPACALTSPNRSSCRTFTSLDVTNDTDKRTLTAAAVPLNSAQPTVLAAVADANSDKSDYKATSLAPSATWNTDLNTGDFAWSYDMPVPEVPGGLKPNVGLSYSSGSIDGRTGNTNNQGSWVGDGFDMWPGYIERRYKPCADDGEKHTDGNKPGDLCWGYDNAFISINGKAGELVPTGEGTWKFKDDDGTKIKRLTSAARDNGDNDNEYWELTDPSGTRYYFGYHKLDGWTSGKETTDSTWTVPVYGNNSGEPCHKETFAASWCQQAWRWNLDYVVDAHGDAITYYYGRETNSYGRDLKKDDNTPYIRGGYLKRIDYGLRDGALFPADPNARVTFENSERCIPEAGVTCAADTIDAKAPYWYDTPWDLSCKSGTTCDEGRLSPTFWTRKRLTRVSTEILKDGKLTPVDSWALAHRWGKADVDYQLELESVQHTGHTGATPVTLPKTTFAYAQLVNRLDKTGDGYAPFVKDRLSTIADEYGGQTDVNYSSPACSFDALPTAQTNTTRCFPQFIGGSTSDDPDRQWFNKYVVTSVTATDRTGGSPDQVTRYSYLGDAAWHYDDDDGLTKDKFKTWSQWRGYAHVRVQTGGQGVATDAMKSQVDHYFLRGMDGDRKNTGGGTKEVRISLDTGEGDPIDDHSSAAGFAYKTVSYSAPGGKILAKSVNRPWHHETAKKARDWGTVTANFTGTASTRTWTSLDDGAGSKWRTTTSNSTYDTVAGRITEVDNAADDSTTADDQCTRTTYATNADKNILTLPSRSETVAVRCEANPDRSKDVISDARTAYDNGTYGTPPSKGDATATAQLKKHDGTNATYLESGATYDSYGRQLTATDISADVITSGSGSPSRTERSDGRTTTTVYTPSTGLPAKITKTSPPVTEGDSASAQTTITELDPLRGQSSASVDANGQRTEFRYDALGRSWMVWLANRKISTLPNYQFNYYVEEGKPTAVATRTLTPSGGGQITSYTLYDGLLRERQVQAPGPEGGRQLTDTFYDERGLVTKTFAPYYTTGKPDRILFKPDNALQVETQTRKTYDGLGRETESRQIAGNGDGGKVLAITSTLYGGDRTTVIPPAGGTAATTLVDALGHTTELRQHRTPSADAPYETTRYAYTPAGKLAKVTDPAGNNWTYTYDQVGNQIQSTDPDKGTTKATFDDRGRQMTTTDARKNTLFTVYDGLGRKTALRDTTADGTLRAKWVYDTVPGAKGQLAEATRYVDGKPYSYKVTQYDVLYRPQRTATVIPDSEGALAGTYQNGTAYHVNGLAKSRSFSAAGSLPGGNWSTTYQDDTLRPIAVFDGQGVRAETSYSYTGKPLQYLLGGTNRAKKAQVTNTYEWGTQRLATSRVDRQDINGVDQYATYGYDPAGNVTSLSDVSRSGTDTQCFRYDYLRRLTEAWTQDKKTCDESPVGNLIAGPVPYWQSYTYDKAGNRTSQIQHAPSGDSGKDLKTTYTYPEPGMPQPHALTSLTNDPADTAKKVYAYDAAGNTTSRDLAAGKQNLTWDAEGHLVKATTEGDSPKTAEYIYDADGNRLIARTEGKTTLYLGDQTEIVLGKGAIKPEATRYMPLGGGNQAVLADDGTYTITLADHHGTGQLAISAGDLSLSQRRTLPFGGIRGKDAPSWPGTKGFVGGTDDGADTGLTHLGAREYDPDTGRFLSVDPLMDLTDPQQMQGYAYSNNNPTTYSDPTGEMAADPDGSGRGVGIVANDGGGMRPSQPFHKDSGGRSSSYNSYNEAKKAMWDKGPSGTKFRAFNVGRGENRGIIMIRYFIHTYDAMRVVPGREGLLLGDDRTWSLDPDTNYRMVLFWDTASGDVTFKVAPSHTTPSTAEISSYTQGGGKAPIKMDIPSRMLPANPIYMNQNSWGTLLGRNIINDHGSDSDVLRVSVHGVQPLVSVGAVDSGLEVMANQRSVRVARSGNAYPDFEVVQYRGAASPKSIARDAMDNEDGFDALEGWPSRILIDNRNWIDGKCVRSCR
ncbi:RHS repeat-associated core domain-containing protein [Streptomyces celluloflavus]|uniref:RHS repeat domain-containing protein n=1 Tax=Streptomyces celluloflavus TaxID=58344 RepID=UPI0036D9986F